MSRQRDNRSQSPQPGKAELAALPMDSGDTCSTCFHWKSPRKVLESEAGECRQGPPTNPTMVGGVRVMTFNLVLGSLPACGAYQPRK